MSYLRSFKTLRWWHVKIILRFSSVAMIQCCCLTKCFGKLWEEYLVCITENNQPVMPKLRCYHQSVTRVTESETLCIMTQMCQLTIAHLISKLINFSSGTFKFNGGCENAKSQAEKNYLPFGTFQKINMSKFV